MILNINGKPTGVVTTVLCENKLSDVAGILGSLILLDPSIPKSSRAPLLTLFNFNPTLDT